MGTDLIESGLGNKEILLETDTVLLTSVVFSLLRSVRFDKKPIHVRVTLERIKYSIEDVGQYPNNTTAKTTSKNQSGT